jgi:Helix-turn-helix domain
MTQCQSILNYLKCGKTLTSMEAFHKFEVTRLPDRVRDLRAKGHSVFAEMVRLQSGKRVARYSL